MLATALSARRGTGAGRGQRDRCRKAFTEEAGAGILSELKLSGAIGSESWSKATGGSEGAARGSILRSQGTCAAQRARSQRLSAYAGQAWHGDGHFENGNGISYQMGQHQRRRLCARHAASDRGSLLKELFAKHRKSLLPSSASRECYADRLMGSAAAASHPGAPSAKSSSAKTRPSANCPYIRSSDAVVILPMQQWP